MTPEKVIQLKMAAVQAVKNYEQAIESLYDTLTEQADASKIQDALEKISTENKYTILTPRQRIQRSIDKIKQHRNALECEITLDERDKAMMTPSQLEAWNKAEFARKNPKAVEIPSCFAATASYHGAKIPMELEVRK